MREALSSTIDSVETNRYNVPSLGDMRNVSEAVMFGSSVEVVSVSEVIPLRIFYPILAI
jgi:hypothetical protein